MVRFGSGAGSEILRRHFQESEDREDRVMAKRPHKKPVAWHFWEKLSADGGSPRPAREARLLPAIFEYVIIRVDSARFDSTPVERLNSRP